MRRTLLAALLVCPAAAVSPVITGPNVLSDYKVLTDKMCEGSLLVDAPLVQQETMDGCALICSCFDGCAGVNFDMGVGNKDTFAGDATDANTAVGQCSFADSCSAPVNISKGGSKLVLQRATAADVSSSVLGCILSGQAEANGYRRISSGGPGPLQCTGFEGSDDAAGDFRAAELGALPSPETCASKCDATSDCVAFVHHVSTKRCTFHKTVCATLVHGTSWEEYYVKAESFGLLPMRRLDGSGSGSSPSTTPSSGSGATPSPSPTPSGGSGAGGGAGSGAGTTDAGVAAVPGLALVACVTVLLLSCAA